MSPLNPVLGETCQRYSKDGTKYYAEQITHHPPISAATMEGPDNKWRFEVVQEFKAGLNGHNSISAHKEGALVLTLYDDTQYIIEEGYVQIEGIVYGEMVINICGTIRIRDVTNNLLSEITFNPDNQEGMLSKVSSSLMFWGAKKEKRPSDHFDIVIYEEYGDKKDTV